MPFLYLSFVYLLSVGMCVCGGVSLSQRQAGVSWVLIGWWRGVHNDEIAIDFSRLGHPIFGHEVSAIY